MRLNQLGWNRRGTRQSFRINLIIQSRNSQSDLELCLSYYPGLSLDYTGNLRKHAAAANNLMLHFFELMDGFLCCHKLPPYPAPHFGQYQPSIVIVKNPLAVWCRSPTFIFLIGVPQHANRAHRNAPIGFAKSKDFVGFIHLPCPLVYLSAKALLDCSACSTPPTPAILRCHT